MHEASIAQSILDIAWKECKKGGYRTIQSVEVRIGSASGIRPGPLATAFDVVKLETPAAGATLLIREIPLGGKCRGCGKRFNTNEQFILACPHCRSRDFSLDTGRELEITQIEAE